MMDAHTFFREQEEREKVLLVREETGRGAFECKKALRHTGWDIDEAVKWLSEHSDNDIYKEKRKIRNVKTVL